ncbi:MAG: TRAP transporter small permease [Treponemataceae bacterium]
MFFKILDKLVFHSTAFCFLAASLIAFAQVISRYVFNASLTWGEEALRYLFIWMFFLAAAACTKEKLHVNLELLVDVFPAQVKKIVLTVMDCLVLLFLSFLVVYGFLFSYENLGQLSAALEIPIGAVNSAIPVGSALMIMYLSRHIYRRFKA